MSTPDPSASWPEMTLAFKGRRPYIICTKDDRPKIYQLGGHPGWLGVLDDMDVAEVGALYALASQVADAARNEIERRIE